MPTDTRQSIHSAATRVLKGPAAKKPRAPESCQSVRQAGCSCCSMPFRHLYWHLVMRLGAMCMREWIGAQANSPRIESPI